MGSEAPQNPGVNTTLVSVKWSTFYQIGCCLCIFPTNLQATFFGGLSPEVRGEAWKFLLQYFPFSSTTRQREVLRKAKEEEYMKIDHMRWSEFKIIIINLKLQFLNCLAYLLKLMAFFSCRESRHFGNLFGWHPLPPLQWECIWLRKQCLLPYCWK